VGQWAVDTGYEIRSCMKSQPACLRNRDLCLGRCTGDGGGVLAQDFATTFVKQELSVASVGSQALDTGRANCTVENRVLEVPLFATGDSFRLFSARLRVRGGFTGDNHPFPSNSVSFLTLRACVHSYRSTRMREGATGMCCNSARAGEGTDSHVRHDNREIPPCLQLVPSQSTSSANATSSPGAVQPEVAIPAASASFVSSSVVRESRAMRGTPIHTTHSNHVLGLNVHKPHTTH
jgi:hypothetical protein